MRIRARASTRSSSTTTSSRSSRSSATPSGGTTPSGSPARPSTTRTWATSATSTAPTTSMSSSRRTRSSPQGLAGDQLLLQHLVRRPAPVPRRRAVVATGRLRALACEHGPRLPLERVPRRHRSRQRLEPDGGARARLSREGALLGRDRAPRHPGRGAEADEGDRLPHAHLGADVPLHRVQRVLAADLLRQPRGGRRVLGVPRARGRDGPVAAAQVRDSRPGRRGAACRRR